MTRLISLVFMLIAFLPSPEAAAQGSGIFSSTCDASKKSSDHCLDCSYMSKDALQDKWRKPIASKGCRFRFITFRMNRSGTYDVLGTDNQTGREEVMTFTHVLSEVQAGYFGREDLAQEDLETEGTELFERANYGEWRGKIKVDMVIQGKKPVSPYMMVDVANITVTYSLTRLSADRIFTALDNINYVNANSPIGKLFKPMVDWAIGEQNRETRKVNACLLRKAKNQFMAMYAETSSSNRPVHSEVKFFCLDSEKYACGDCFRNNSNNLKDLAYQIVKPENGTLRSIRDALVHIGETTAIEWDDPTWGN